MTYEKKLKLRELPPGLAEAVAKCPLIIGIGPTAWPRIIPSFYFPKYKIISLHDCQDNDFISDFGVEVFSLRAMDPDLEVAAVTPSRILTSEVTQKFLAAQKEPFAFLIYKSSTRLESVCQERGWRFIGNTKELEETYENKKNFKEILRKILIEPIPGDNMLIEELTDEKFIEYQQKFGQKKLVLQLAEMTYGGGSGTLFIENVADLGPFRERTAAIRKDLEGKKKEIKTVNISPYIESITASVACCSTRFGVLVSPIQMQVVDIAEVGMKRKSRSGNFCGHDWSFRHFPPEVQQQARQMAKKFGQYLYQHSYRGIFGLDILIEENGKVWPMECNPRFTDAFPMVSLLLMGKGAVPMEVFHILESLGIDYHCNFEKLDQSYQQELEGSQILIHNPFEQLALKRGVLKAGVYRLSGGKLEFLRLGFSPFDFQDKNEFLFTEGVLKKEVQIYTSTGRLCRLLKKGTMLKEASELTEEFKQVVALAYEQFKMLSVHTGLKDDHGVKILYIDRLAADTLAESEQADMVSVYTKIKEGFWRPHFVAWRKELTAEPAIKQIQSKRAQKQIKSDEKKISGLGIEVRTLPEIEESLFEKWLVLYQKTISEKGMGVIKVDREWLANKRSKGKKVGAVLAFRGGELIGGDLFFEIKEALCVGYGIAERVPGLAGGLGLLLDYHFLEFACEHGYQQISFGQDANLYGFDLSLGLLSYKAKLGLKPLPSKNKVWMTTFFLNFEKLKEPLAFFAGEGEGLKLVVISDSGNKEEDLGIYPPPGIEKVEYYAKAEVVKKHQEFLIQFKEAK